MSISFTQKTERTLQLLLGLRYPDVAKALSAYGFDDDEQKEGWELLRALGKSRGQILQPVADATVIAQLDTWENRWFPVAQATLTRRYPAAAAKFFQNLSQVTGREVAMTVQLFVDRYDELTVEGSSYGPEGVKAKETLAARGITDEVMSEARALLESLRHTAPAATPASIEQAKAEAQKAEDALWGWYLEWSQVARTAIKNRWLLHQLGFLSSSGSASEDDTPLEGGSATPTNGATPTTTAVAS